MNSILSRGLLALSSQTLGRGLETGGYWLSVLRLWEGGWRQGATGSQFSDSGKGVGDRGLLALSSQTLGRGLETGG